MVLIDEKDVKIVIDGATVPEETHFFQCCHLGMIFLSQMPIELYKKMDFKLSLKEGGVGRDNINCTGVVVDSQFEDIYGMYKTYLVYTDIDQNTKEKLKYISEEKELRCPFCVKS